MSTRWTVIVPVKGAIGAKTRLGAALDAATRGRLAIAFARDTITAAAHAAGVDAVVVVTNDDRLDDLRFAPRVSVVGEGDAKGLNAAIARGIAHVRSAPAAAAASPAIGVLLGDLPALRPIDLSVALDRASAHERAFVVDWEGTGTTLLTAAPGAPIPTAFGVRSAAAHAGLGYTAVDVPAASTARLDVDTPDALAAAARVGVGRATRAVLDGIRLPLDD